MAKKATRRTWGSIAADLGIDPGSLQRLRKREDWPVEVSATRADVVTADQIEVLRRWRQTALREDRAAPFREAIRAGGSQMPMPDAAAVSVRYKLEQTIWTRVKREILQGKYVERHLHEAALVALAETFVSKLADMQQALPLELDGLDAGEIEKRIGTRFDEARQAIIERRDIELRAATDGPAVDDKPRSGRPTASHKPPRSRSRPPSPFKIGGKPRSRIAKR